MSRVFDESKHPRDELGRFTEKAVYDPKTKTFAQNTPYKAILQWDRERKLREAEYIYNSDSPPDDLFRLRLDFFGKDYLPLTVEDIPKETDGFRNMELLNTRHHSQHVYEMGYKNQYEYEKAAIEFWKNGEGEVYADNLNRDFCKYNQQTEQFLVIADTGEIRTFYLLHDWKFKRKKRDLKLCLIKDK